MKFRKIFSLLMATLCVAFLLSDVRAADVTILREGGDWGDLYKVFVNTTINATGVYYSDAIPLRKRFGDIGLFYKAISATSTPDIKIEYQVSPDADENNFTVPDGASPIETNLIAETIKIKFIEMYPMRYVRFKITGNAGNPVDTVLNLSVFVK